MSEPTIDPTPEQLNALLADHGEGPIVMLNLLRFRERAGGVLAEEGVTGEEAYGRYAEAVASSLARVGGSLEFAARCKQNVIGPDSEAWDVVALARYPSRHAFLQMVGDPDFQQKHELRSAALADSRLVCCEPVELG